MEITVKLHGALRRFRPAAEGAGHDPFLLTVAQGSSLKDVLADLDLSEETVSAMAVNGAQAHLDSILEDGDMLHLFPPAAGGSY